MNILKNYISKRIQQHEQMLGIFDQSYSTLLRDYHKDRIKHYRSIVFNKNLPKPLNKEIMHLLINYIDCPSWFDLQQKNNSFEKRRQEELSLLNRYLGNDWKKYIKND